MLWCVNNSLTSKITPEIFGIPRLQDEACILTKEQVYRGRTTHLVSDVLQRDRLQTTSSAFPCNPRRNFLKFEVIREKKKIVAISPFHLSFFSSSSYLDFRTKKKEKKSFVGPPAAYPWHAKALTVTSVKGPISDRSRKWIWLLVQVFQELVSFLFLLFILLPLIIVLFIYLF